MSWTACDTAVEHRAICSGVDTVIVPRAGDIGGFEVRRALPSAKRQMVGPFIFFDQMGPANMEPGQGIDVRPHPHIGLATITYLFEGEIMHRDSLGTEIAIRPGAVNWMTAGAGITHSERTGSDVRKRGGPLSGIQAWIALPRTHENCAPAFVHYGKAELPTHANEGRTLRLIAGSLFGLRSPVETHSELIYADVALEAGATIAIPADCEERGVYIVSGEVGVADQRFEQGRLLVLHVGEVVTVTAITPARFMLLGGEPMDGPRFIWWNFVSSSREKIEEAKQRWKTGAFPAVPGETDFIPLPQ